MLAAVGTAALGGLSGCAGDWEFGFESVPSTDSPTPTATPTPPTVAYKLDGFRLHVDTASDAAFDDPDALDLTGLIYVWGRIGSGNKIVPLGTGGLNHRTLVWSTGGGVQTIDEGDTESISLNYRPVVIEFGPQGSFNPRNARIVVNTSLREEDKGWNPSDTIVSGDQFRWGLHGTPGQQTRVLGNGSSEVHLKFTISRA